MDSRNWCRRVYQGRYRPIAEPANETLGALVNRETAGMLFVLTQFSMSRGFSEPFDDLLENPVIIDQVKVGLLLENPTIFLFDIKAATAA